MKPVARIAPAWPFKRSYKTTITLHVLQIRHLNFKKKCRATKTMGFALTRAKPAYLKTRFPSFKLNVDIVKNIK